MSSPRTPGADIVPACRRRDASAPPETRRRRKLAAQNKLYVRDRIALLVDEGSFVEDGQLANALAARAAGRRRRHRPGAGRRPARRSSWPTTRRSRPARGARARSRRSSASPSARCVEELPIFWLIDSAGARITDQVDAVPGPSRRRADLPQPGRAVGQGAADLLPVRAVGRRRRVHPGVLRRRDHGRGQRLDVPRLAADGRDGRRREGHAGGDGRRPDARHGVRLRRQPRRRRRRRHRAGSAVLLLPADVLARAAAAYVDANRRSERSTADESCRRRRVSAVRHPRRSSTAWSTRTRSSRSSRCSRPSCRRLRPARRRGRSGSWPTTRRCAAACCSSTRADKAARFIWLCDAFNVPLLYLADVPGFMIGSEVERQGIIRHGAKMITAVSEATVPQISVIVRKAYGAGLYAMAGPGFMPDACIALPTAQDRGDGAGGGGQRGVRQQDRGDRRPGRAGRVRGRAARGVRDRTSTCCGWRPTW